MSEDMSRHSDLSEVFLCLAVCRGERNSRWRPSESSPSSSDGLMSSHSIASCRPLSTPSSSSSSRTASLSSSVLSSLSLWQRIHLSKLQNPLGTIFFLLFCLLAQLAGFIFFLNYFSLFSLCWNTGYVKLAHWM